MRATLMMVLMLPVMLAAMTAAGSEETQAADEAAAAATAADAKTEAVDDADMTAKADEANEEGEFKVPPGFRVKKRGKFTLYCRTESVMGTLIPSEKCYDETGIREMLRSQRDDQERIDQMRKICGQTGSCGGSG